MSSLLSLALLSMVATSNPAASQAGAATIPSAQAGGQVQSLQRLTFRGTTSIAKAAAASAAAKANAAVRTGAAAKPNGAVPEVKFQQRGWRASDVRPAMNQRFSRLASGVAPPNVAGRGVVAPDRNFFGFPGLTHLDQKDAGTLIYAGTQFSIEPPDQGLCVGNGFVLEAVNDALAVYAPGAGGGLISGPTSLSEFFGIGPAIIRPKGPRGPFISDPKCYFDRDTQRWFLTELEYDVNASTGAPLGRSSVFIAISQTADPTGAFNLYSFDTTDRGSPNCPCFGDQPLLGADANGIYVSTNEFPLVGFGFNGSQIYALSKFILALGGSPTVVHINAGALPVPNSPFGAIWASIQPATSPELSRPNQARQGTEYFLSALDFAGTGDNRVAVWALTNTSSLRFATPNVALQNVVIRSEAYRMPPTGVIQKPGLTPLGTSLGEPLPLIATNDDRMNQVVFQNGRLWSGVNTTTGGGNSLTSAIAYFSVEPALKNKKLVAQVAAQGYVAVAGQSTIFPSIAVDAGGTAILTGTLVGPAYFPSAFYVPLTGRNESLRLAGPGALPEDGFSAYVAFGGSGVGRWGDYSAAVADERGRVWIAAEYIPNSPRTLLANWGTFVGVVP